MVRVFDVQMYGQHVGQPTNLAPAHGIGLSCDGEGTRSRLANPTSHQMTVDDGVDLVRA